MKRPGRDLSRAFLLRKARMRELEARNPPSRSLLSNIQDLDNCIPVNVNDLNATRSQRPNDNSGGMWGVRTELLAVLSELRYITRKMKDDNSASEVTNDWKFAAMVIDRLFFWIFTIAFVISTLAIYLSAPNLLA